MTLPTGGGGGGLAEGSPAGGVMRAGPTPGGTRQRPAGPARTGSPPDAAAAPDRPAAPASWLLAPRVTAPARTSGYFDRPALIERLGRIERRRVTVLAAPAGFGKTTLLAELFRRERERGRVAAWVTLTGDDTPAILGAYLAGAFGRAGLNLPVLDDRAAARRVLPHAARHTALLTRAVETHAAPCLLVLDDADRLAVPETVDAVNTLLRHGPRNLHVAVAYRRNPGLDLDDAVLAGRGIRLGAEQLRFSRPEIARFFGGGLSPDELGALAARTEGWPVALRIHRNLRAGGPPPGGARGPGADALAGAQIEAIERMPPGGARGPGADEGVTADALGERLLGTLSHADREFLLDVALFDWIEPALADEVLGAGATRRLAGLAELDGLLHDRGDAVRLHPLVRDWCVARRRRDTPDRFRRIQVAIARALARRNRLVPALRHARDAGDERLAGDVLERTQGLPLWFLEGLTRLRGIDRFLTPAVVERYPRLDLLRCIVLVKSGRVGEAHALCAAVGRRTRGFTRDRAGGDDRKLRADSVLVRALLAGFGCLPAGGAEVRALLAEAAAVADDADVDPAIRGGCSLVLCANAHRRARFEVSRRRGLQAKAHFERCGSRYGGLFHDLHAGVAAMARGEAQAAAGHYAHARRTVKQYFPEDGESALVADVLTAELDLERDRPKAVAQRAPEPGKLCDTATWFDVYAAAWSVAAETASERGGAAAGLAVLDDARAHARSLGLAGVVRYLSALRVSVLVAGGRLDEAGEAWRCDRLPDAEPAIVDPDGQSWREMEALAEARIRLLAARGDPDAARGLAARLCAVAGARGLARTLMRGLAAAMVVEYRAGDAARAAARLAEFLARIRTTDYPRPLVRERAVAREVLEHLLETTAEPALRAAADALRGRLGGPPPAAAFTPREIDVLQELATGAKDREIAPRLGLSGDGLRYHVRRIYRKTRAAGRVDAVRRARALGVLPPAASAGPPPSGRYRNR